MKEKISEVQELLEKGYLDRSINPTLNLFSEIKRLKKEKNAIILAHYYQDSAIQDVADYIGDSLGLSQKAASTDAKIIVFAGVHFMAETAKILCPKKKVLLPDLKAGCSLADTCPEAEFRIFKEKYQGHTVIMYVNSTAAIKAMSDIVCTSSNAVAIVNSLPKDQPIIFGPDKNLGAYVAKQTGRELVLWNGSCMVHEIFSRDKILNLKNEYKNAELIAHPECEEAILDLADYIASTTGLLKYTSSSSANEFIVATEAGILYQMSKANPDKKFIPAPTTTLCACNNCPHMKLNTLEKLYNCLKYDQPEIILEQKVIDEAHTPIKEMLDISKKMGL